RPIRLVWACFSFLCKRRDCQVSPAAALENEMDVRRSRLGAAPGFYAESDIDCDSVRIHAVCLQHFGRPRGWRSHGQSLHKLLQIALYDDRKELVGRGLLDQAVKLSDEPPDRLFYPG